ncbi:zinc finger homeobox protein 3-like [Tubulanus polymorphus]|uniref:zinc finger homeobox protein 3-like n=1 Tax=Tubulanus polymorphus TaxID=672921 RepID=UPI003DA6145C
MMETVVAGQDSPAVESPPRIGALNMAVVAEEPATDLKQDSVSNDDVANDNATSEKTSSTPVKSEENDTVSDVESFDGKIVYNPDGSAYIIEGDTDLSDSDSLMEFRHEEGSIIETKSKTIAPQIPVYPQIANAFYVQRNPGIFCGAFYNNMSASSSSYGERRNAFPEAPIMHSYRVYDLRSGKQRETPSAREEATDASQNMSESDDDKKASDDPKNGVSNHPQTVPTKPILMCFLCKLSFGFAKSFVAHAISEHGMTLNDKENQIMSGCNASAIIQAFGKDKEPLLSFLEPNVSSERKVASDDVHKQSTVDTSAIENQAPSQETVPRNVSVKCNIPVPQVALDEKHAQEVVAEVKDKAEKMDIDEEQKIKNNNNLPAVVDGTKISALHSNGSDLPQTTAVATSLPIPLSHHFSQISASSMVPSLSQMFPSATCDEHPQGKDQGVECPKCDMILGSSRSLGGHMTMMHSRNSCKTLKCPKCNWHYKYQETLEIHMKEKHPENDAQCMYCITNQPHPRLARGETYTCGYKPYRCDVCNYSTTTKGNLSIHMQSDKHINNMQELQNGTQEMKLPPVTSCPQPPITPPAAVDINNVNKKSLKPKPTWRCDVCNYETNVARNLRIHMTSEKHTHNMMVLQQNVKHMQRDMQLMNHMAMFDASMMGVPTPVNPNALPPGFPYDQSMFIPAASMQNGPAAAAIDAPVDLTKAIDGEHGSDAKRDAVGKTDSCKMYQCCICNAFATDSIEGLHQHMQLDRSKSRPDDNVIVSQGNYMCQLCQYKTNLKANFQLHCKTDKHLQRLQLVNHIKEGGQGNEWRIKYMNMSNPVQIKCTCCDYFTNSIHKLQLHASNPRHEICAKLYAHLHRSEKSVKSDHVYYHCSLCNYSTKTRLNLIQHVRTMKHLRNESLRQMQIQDQGKMLDDVISDIFSINEYSENDNINFEDGDGELVEEDVNEFNAVMPDGSMKENMGPDAQKTISGLELAGAPDNSNSASEQVHVCPYCNYSSISELRIQAHIHTQHMQMGGRGFLCPLCQEKYTEKPKLERHLMAAHNVSSDAVQRLMVMVDQTELFNNASNQQPKSPGTPTDSPATADSNNVLTEPAENVDNSSDVSDADAIRINHDEDGAILNEKGEYEEQYRCTTCSKTFSKIDDLYAHQNELGHLELKQTPRGPGYLCWKRGCNQYFKTAQALQIHFREIHAKRQQLAISERHVYKYRCNQCSLAFKTLEKLQTHSQYHTIRNATKCNMCGRSFRTLSALKKHVETTHYETMTELEIAEYQAALASNPLNLIENNCNSPSLDKENLEVSEGEAKGRADEPGLSDTASEKSNSLLDDDQSTQDSVHNAMDVDDPEFNNQHFAEDYINSQAIAEDSYNDPTRKFKCHRCKVAFTKQNYLTSHNKTLLHRKGDRFNYPLEKYLDPNRPYKCDVCKESFTQKNILLVHYNSVSHLHKLKQVGQTGHHGTSSPPLNNISPPSSMTVSSRPTPVPSPVFTSSMTGVSTSTVDGKPYKCNICKVAYSQGSTLDIHMRSVLHQTRASKLQELAMTGQIDMTQPLIEQPEPQKAHSQNVSQQHKKILADMLQQKQHIPMSSSPINHPSALFQPMVSMGTPVTQPLSLVTTNPMTPLSTFSPSPSPQPSASSQQPMYSCNRCNSIFVSAENLTQHQQMYCYFQAPGMNLQNPYSFVPRRSKTQVHKNLLANFGFECVMHFNELNQIVKTDEVEDVVRTDNGDADEENDGDNDDDTEKKNVPEIKSEDKDVEVKEESVKNVEDEKKNVVDLPEVSREKCKICLKQFSSIWVLKAHQEEVHKNLVPTSLVEMCSEHIKDDLMKKLPPAQQIGDSVMQSQATPPIPSQPNTPNSDISVNVKQENNPMAGSAMDLSQMSPLSLVNMMPISLNMPMAMALQPPLNVMMPTLNLDSSFPTPAMMDPNFLAAQKMQQQQQQAQANSQKRARTRISDEQLKILRGHFDINNSPSEEQIIAMSEQSGLPQKVIKHWFRNTLFKERQRNKDSPYNFNNPPSTTLNLEEYEKTGKITMSESDGNDNESTKSSETSDVKEERLLQQAESEKAKLRHQDVALAASSFHQHQQQEAARVQMQLEYEQVQKEQQQVMEAVKQQLAEAQQAAVAAVAAEAQRQKEFRENRERQIEDIIASSVAQSIGGGFHPASAATPMMNPATLQSFVDRTPSTSASESSQPPTPVSSSGAGSRRANRTRFTDYQLKVLQEYFEQNAYPKDDDLEHLSKLLNLSPRVIVVWFQNARQKARKVYENQPPIETPSPSEENSHRFHRTPGLNYQCKKCLTVFQRYYELIKHQKKHCFKDEDISPSQVFSGLESNMSHNSSDSKQGVLNSSSSSNEENRVSVKQEPVPSFKCEKCNLTFTRFDLWQEHQSIHMMNPSIFPNFPAESAFGLLQNIAQQSAQQQQQQQQHNPLPDEEDDDDKFLKRKMSDDEDDKDEQPRDKRLRTTILPEQLDYLYQKYQIDCNPSRKQLETIAQEVGLKKRVVQVWFQNTRARERKGQYRAHQQLIHKRCPFCRALFRAKSALESHLATKHPEEMARGDINVDNIPDDIPEGPNSLPPNSPGLDMAKLMANPFNVQPFMPFMPPNALGMPHVADPMHLQMKRMYEDSVKRYMDDMNQRPPSSEPSQISATSNKPSTSSTRAADDGPLDLSKPVRVNIDERYPHGPFTNLSERSCDDLNSSRMSYDESVSDNRSEGDVNDFNDDSNHSDATSPSNGFHRTSSSGALAATSLQNMQSNSAPKRFRTQMTSVQVKVMKYLFVDYKTPTMAECEMLGREIGLPKRVIQVWFQNARAKEKKAKLGYGKPFGTEALPEQNLPPDDCKLCNFKYTHKYSIQDHIFTKKHIDNVQKHVQLEISNERDITDPAAGLPRQPPARDTSGQTTPKSSADVPTSSHLAQLQAMGMQAAMGLPTHMGGFHSNTDTGNGSAFSESKEHKKETVSSNASSKSEHKEDNSKKEKMNPLLQAGLPPQMMSPFGPMFPGADGNFLPIMYPAAMPGFFPGLGMPMMQPAIFPGAENFMSYDPTRFGTPLSLLQIPPQAIRSVTAKLSEPSETKAQYTQDCKNMSDLKSVVNAASLSVAKDSIVDVGYICKKCHMVYPAKDACVAHQQVMCYPGKNIAELKTIIKLEQVQYKCGACNDAYSTVQEFKSHSDSDAHKLKLNVGIPSKMEVD